MRLLRRLTILMAGLTGVVAGGQGQALPKEGVSLRMPGRGGSLVSQALRASRISSAGKGPVGQWASGRPAGQWGCFFAGPPEPPTRILHRRQKRIEHGPASPSLIGLVEAVETPNLGLGSVARHRKGTRVFHNHNVRVVPCFVLRLVAEELSRLWTLAASRVPGAGCDGL
ncbi:hypothetical protein BT67DRAFT_103869 [Trichocladium antarcticum]|uniref:Uncharacterized protein n=1 Tax=Trichocladium antarcticum TaxID=1450529 RepID=A0AAN6UT07_9PEZI|nr:hypothetical protein BT67DRAFT_103869 [Trichocladium antarcticum]